MALRATASPVQYDATAGEYRLNDGLVISADGTGDGSHTIAGAAIVSNLEIHSVGGTDPGGIAVHRHSDSQVLGGHFLSLKSRGTHVSPTIVADNDVLAWIAGCGYDGTDYELAASIQMRIDGTPGSNDMPGDIAFFTNAGSQTLSERLTIQADGNVVAAVAFKAASYNVAGAPSASGLGAGSVIYVTDGDAGSPCLAVSNGTNWLRIALGTAISAS